MRDLHGVGFLLRETLAQVAMLDGEMSEQVHLALVAAGAEGTLEGLFLHLAQVRAQLGLEPLREVGDQVLVQSGQGREEVEALAAAVQFSARGLGHRIVAVVAVFAAARWLLHLRLGHVRRRPRGGSRRLRCHVAVHIVNVDANLF